MTRGEDPDEVVQAVRFARGARGLTQKQFAEEAGVNRSQLSLYEKGHRAPRRRTRERLVAGAGLSLPQFARLLPVLRSASSRKPPSDSPEDASSLAAEIARGVADAVLVALGDLPFGHLAPEVPAQSSAMDRVTAPGRWARLWAHDPATQRLLVEAMEEYQGWELCEHGCDASVRVAADDPAQALALAELALFIAERALGGELWRQRLQGYCWAFIGNARRVGSDHRVAEQAFAEAHKLWEAGAAADPCVLDASRVLDLEASLRRTQRRFAEAVELLDQALAVSVTPARAAHILLAKGFTYEQMGDCERAIAALQQAAPLIDAEREPRQLFGLRFNLAVNLCHLGRYAEATPIVAEVRELAIALRNDLDLLRLLWLEARVAAGLGRRAEAIAALRQVRDDFAAGGLSFDAGLASLNLAVLLLDEGRTAEVRELASEMLPIFGSLSIDREALATLQVFCQAAEQETATAELGHRLLAFLERARYNSELRFDPRVEGASERAPAARASRRRGLKERT